MLKPRNEFQFDQLNVLVYDNKEVLGAASADFVENKIKEVVSSKGKARVIFATGASQFEFLAALCEKEIPWESVEAFHLDEYVGLSDDHPASFRCYLRERLFNKVNPATVHYLDGCVDKLDEECERYSKVLTRGEIDLACIGIGENGHIAFNDPPVADFKDPKLVKVVELDEPCRNQQYGEGWFPSFDNVPKFALSLTVPAIMQAKTVNCVVPDERKAEAVKNALYGPIQTSCPASILRTHTDAFLRLDQPAASLLST